MVVLILISSRRRSYLKVVYNKLYHKDVRVFSMLEYLIFNEAGATCSNLTIKAFDLNYFQSK